MKESRDQNIALTYNKLSAEWKRKLEKVSSFSSKLKRENYPPPIRVRSLMYYFYLIFLKKITRISLPSKVLSLGRVAEISRDFFLTFLPKLLKIFFEYVSNFSMVILFPRCCLNFSHISLKYPSQFLTFFESYLKFSLHCLIRNHFRFLCFFFKHFS